jgi:hypothetical protein
MAQGVGPEFKPQYCEKKKIPAPCVGNGSNRFSWLVFFLLQYWGLNSGLQAYREALYHLSHSISSF